MKFHSAQFVNDVVSDIIGIYLDIKRIIPTLAF